MAFEYYDILGVSRDAGADELKKAYRKKAMEHHPDRHGGDKSKEAEFKKINEAYAVLSDESKRAAYDGAGGRSDFASGFGGGGSPFGEGFDFGDIFESFFGGGFHGGSSRGKRREVGEDIELNVSATFAEGILGGRKTISYDRFELCSDCHGSWGKTPNDTVACPDCGGNGRVRKQSRTVFGVMEQVVACDRCRGSGKIIKNPCPTCSGKRYVRNKKERELDIPAGIEDGMTIKLRGDGHEGVDGNGDLYVHFSVPEEEGVLIRDGADIHCTLSLDPSEMVLGCEKEVELPVLGKRKVQIKAGSQHGDSIKFKQEGTPKLPGNSRGDLIFIFSVVIPRHPSAEEKRLYAEIARSKGLEWDEKGLFARLFGG